MYDGLVIFSLLSLARTGSFSLAPKDNPNSPCVLLDITFTMTLKLMDEEKEVENLVITDTDQNVSVAGSCGGPQKSTIILRFKNGIMWSFVFTRSDEMVHLKRLVQLTPNKIFNSSDAPSSISAFIAPNTVISKSNTSYSCASSEQMNYTASQTDTGKYKISVQVTESSIQAQAFDINKGKFSPSEVCSDDKRTTTPTPTTISPSSTTNMSSTPTAADNITSPATTSQMPNTTGTGSTLPPAATPVNNYVVSDNNATCIRLSAAIDISIRYAARNGAGYDTRETSTFQVPSDATAQGSCSLTTSSQELVVEFNNGWNLRFIFTTGDDVIETFLGNEVGSSYRISNVTLSYVIDELNFPNASKPTGTEMLAAPQRDEGDFPAKIGDANYYQCNSSVKLVVNDDVSVNTRFLVFQAFSEDDAQFAGTASTCYSDQDPEATVSIVVGCLVMTLIVAGIILFIVKQYRNRPGYQPM